MFWIPICAVACFIYLIVYMVQYWSDNKRLVNDRELDYQSSCFTKQTLDADMEKQVSQKYEKKGDLAYQTVCDFIGFSLPDEPSPTIYVMCIKWATAIEMAKSGKIPYEMVYRDMGFPRRTKLEIEFSERFYLQLEKELRNAGVRTMILCSHCIGSDKNSLQIFERYPLNQFVRKNGYGKTNANDVIRFVNTTIFALDYPEAMVDNKHV